MVPAASRREKLLAGAQNSPRATSSFVIHLVYYFPMVCAGSSLSSVIKVLNAIFLQVCFSGHPLGATAL